MASFRYRAVDESGAVVKGFLAAESPAEARQQLRRMRLFPERVERAPVGAAGPGLALPGTGARTARQVALFTRQCAVLLKSGVPVVEALEVLAQQAESRRLAETLFEVREAVNAGRPLAEALSEHPRFFDRAYTAMVASGEKSGMLDVVFARLAEFLQRRRVMLARLSTALIYPAILVMMAVGLLIFLSAFVVPMMQPLLAQHEGALPLTTHALFAVSDFVRTYIWLAVPLALGAFIALAALQRLDAGRRLLDAVVLSIPLFGRLVRKGLVARFCTSFATLLRTGVPALDALETLADLTPNALLAREIATIHRHVMEGEDISAPMRESRLFPPMVSYMVAVGERSGDLAEVLEHVSESYDTEVEIAARRILTVLEPALVLVMAGVVGFIAMSLMTTILELSNI